MQQKNTSGSPPGLWVGSVGEYVSIDISISLVLPSSAAVQASIPACKRAAKLFSTYNKSCMIRTS